MHIHYLAMMGKLEELKQLLKKQSELLNAQDGELRDTPLVVAACSSKVAVVEYLLSQGADIYIRNSSGENILHGLMFYIRARPTKSMSERLINYYIIAAMILQRDAELRADNPALTPLLDVKNKDGHTPLWIVRLDIPEDNGVREKIQIMAKAAEVQVQRERALAEGEREDEELRRGHSYFETVPNPPAKPNGLARLLARFGIGWHTKGFQLPEPEEAPLLGEETQGKLKVS